MESNSAKVGWERKQCHLKGQDRMVFNLGDPYDSMVVVACYLQLEPLNFEEHNKYGSPRGHDLMIT